jgi:putative restriction endonuclease
MSETNFGEIPEYPEGTEFENRYSLSAARVHRPTQAGIGGSQGIGADSIVLSGGYEDDEDHGDVIIYTGQGGRDPKTGKQVAHQTLSLVNLALARNKTLGLPVRVIRGAGHKSEYSPTNGYRYDGLYRVADYWREVGREGFYVWRYRLERIRSDDAEIEGSGEDEVEFIQTGTPAPRIRTSVLRIVRDTRQSRWVKEQYDYCCQVCGIRLEGSAGPYAEAAHIMPLGIPHNGPDIPENILCLCPNIIFYLTFLLFP